MAIVKQTLGANTVMLSVSANTSVVGQYTLDTYETLLAAVKTEITAKSWNVHDEIAATATSHIHTVVFEALNADGVSHKFMIQRWDTIAQEIRISTCEYWNATTHVATNEAYTYGDSSPIPWRQDVYDLVIFATQYWCILQSFHVNEPSQWAGVVEVEREDTSDISSLGSYAWSPYNVGTVVPNWGFISSNTWLQGFNTSTGVGSSQDTASGMSHLYEYSTSRYNSIVCFPRNKLGQTGFAAASNQSASTEFFTTPMPTDNPANFRGYRSNLPINILLSNYIEQGRTNQWDTNKKLVYTLKVIENIGNNTTLNNRGAIMGMKLTKPIGNIMNKVSLPLNSKYYFDAAGTNTPHFVLNTHGYNINTNANNSLSFLYDNFASKNLISLMPSFSEPVWVGKYVYALSANDMYLLDLTQGSLIGANRIKVATGVRTPVYDGSRYMYYSDGSNTITKFDTRTNTVVVTANAGCTSQIGNLCYTPEYLYYVDSTANSSSAGALRRLLLSDMTTTSAMTGFTGPTYAGAYVVVLDDFGGVNIFTRPGSGTTADVHSLFSWRLPYGAAAATALAKIATPRYQVTRGTSWDGTLLNATVVSAPFPVGVVRAGNTTTGSNKFTVVTRHPSYTSGTNLTETTTGLAGYSPWMGTYSYAQYGNGNTALPAQPSKLLIQSYTVSTTGTATVSDVSSTNIAGSNTQATQPNAHSNSNVDSANSRLYITRLFGAYAISGSSQNQSCILMTDQYEYMVNASAKIYPDSSNTGKIYGDGYRLYTNSGHTYTNAMHIYNNINSGTIATTQYQTVQPAQVLIPA